MDATQFEKLAKLTVSTDRVEAMLSVQAGIDESLDVRDLIINLLQHRGVTVTEDRISAIDSALRRYYAGGGKPIEAIVARGVAPQNGDDQWLQLDAQFAPDTPAQTDDSGNVDHYGRSVFCIVQAGQRVGTLHPATKGVDGVDVRGAPIKASDGKPSTTRIGDGLEVGPDGSVVAAVAGIVEHTRDIIRVSPDLHIRENVDFSTGNIAVPGNLRIDRSIRDCFEVRCGQTLEVNGLVEAADIVTGLDAKLNHGMAARAKGSIEIGRDLYAKYLDNVDGHVGRDIIVEREIRESDLVVGRRIVSPTCTFISGSIVAAAECRLKELGGEGEAPCEIALGKIPKLEELLRRMTDMHQAIGKRVAKSHPGMDKAAAIRDQHEKLARKIASTVSFISAHTTAELIVDELIQPGAVLWIGPMRAKLFQAVKGPVRVWVDDENTPKITDLQAKRTLPLEDFARIKREPRYLDLSRILMDCAAAA